MANFRATAGKSLQSIGRDVGAYRSAVDSQLQCIALLSRVQLKLLGFCSLQPPTDDRKLHPE